jgi:hypothetical protein
VYNNNPQQQQYTQLPSNTQHSIYNHIANQQPSYHASSLPVNTLPATNQQPVSNNSLPVTTAPSQPHGKVYNHSHYGSNAVSNTTAESPDDEQSSGSPKVERRTGKVGYTYDTVYRKKRLNIENFCWVIKVNLLSIKDYFCLDMALVGIFHNNSAKFSKNIQIVNIFLINVLKQQWQHLLFDLI